MSGRIGVLTSGAIAASAVVLANRGYLVGVDLYNGDGSDAGLVTIYDNATAASGDELAVLGVVDTTGASEHIDFAIPIPCAAGLYAEITGTTKSVVVRYGSVQGAGELA